MTRSVLFDLAVAFVIVLIIAAALRPWSNRVWYALLLLIAFGFGLGVVTFGARAHDLWISKEGRRNAAGEWCCGAGDCFVVSPDIIRTTARGYELGGTFGIGAEVVPYREAMPSPDGLFWRCHRPDGSRRCFFAPPPGA